MSCDVQCRDTCTLQVAFHSSSRFFQTPPTAVPLLPKCYFSSIEKGKRKPKTKWANLHSFSLEIICLSSSCKSSPAYSSKMAFVVLADGVQKRTIAATFSRKGFTMLESCCVSTHTLMPAWCAEKPSLTSSQVRPFTSFEAAQSSRTMRVFVPLKAKLVNFSHASTWCCSQMITYSRGSLSPNLYSVRL